MYELTSFCSQKIRFFSIYSASSHFLYFWNLIHYAFWISLLNCVKAQTQGANSPLVFGYIEPRTSSDFQRIYEIDGNRLTHVLYAFAYPSESGNVTLYKTVDGIARETDAISTAMKGDMPGSDCYCSGTCLKGFFHQLIYLKRRYPHLRTILSIGGWTFSEHFTTIFADAAKSALFIESATRLMLTYGFDGIDIDWEFPGKSQTDAAVVRPNDWPNVAKVAAQMKAYWKSKIPQYNQYILTLCLPATKIPKYQPTLTNEVLTSLTPNIDYFLLMAYEYHWDAMYAGHGAPLFYTGREQEQGSLRPQLSVSQAIISFTQVVPKEKLIMGLPAYAMGINVEPQAQPNTCLGARYISSAGTIGWRKLKASIPSLFAETAVDSSSVAAWTCNRTVFYSFDSPETAQIKREFTRNNGLAGNMIWDLSTDFSTDSSSSILKGLTSAIPPTIQKRRKNICIPNSNFCNVACANNENPFEEEPISSTPSKVYKVDTDYSSSTSPSPSGPGSTSGSPSTQNPFTRPAFTLISSSLRLHFNKYSVFFLILFYAFM